MTMHCKLQTINCKSQQEREQVYQLALRRAKMYSGCVRALLINHNRINVRKRRWDRQMEGQTPDSCFTLLDHLLNTYMYIHLSSVELL